MKTNLKYIKKRQAFKNVKSFKTIKISKILTNCNIFKIFHCYNGKQFPKHLNGQKFQKKILPNKKDLKKRLKH